MRRALGVVAVVATMALPGPAASQPVEAAGAPALSERKADLTEPARSFAQWKDGRGQRADNPLPQKPGPFLRKRERDGKFRRGHRFGRPIPYFRVYRDDYAEPLPPPPAPPVEPPPPDTAAAPEPVEPPDPRGPLHASPARGTAPPSDPWALGEPLPPGLPHVTLDWRRYDLPEPPPGRIYARVGRTVLLITAAERVVEEVVDGG